MSNEVFESQVVLLVRVLPHVLPRSTADTALEIWRQLRNEIGATCKRRLANRTRQGLIWTGISRVDKPPNARRQPNPRMYHDPTQSFRANSARQNEDQVRTEMVCFLARAVHCLSWRSCDVLHCHPKRTQGR